MDLSNLAGELHQSSELSRITITLANGKSYTLVANPDQAIESYNTEESKSLNLVDSEGTVLEQLTLISEHIVAAHKTYRKKHD